MAAPRVVAAARPVIRLTREDPNKGRSRRAVMIAGKLAVGVPIIVNLTAAAHQATVATSGV